MEDTFSRETVPSDLQLISDPDKFSPTLSTQVLYSADELKETANRVKHRLMVLKMQEYQNKTTRDMARKEFIPTDVDSKKKYFHKEDFTESRRDSSSPSILQYVKSYEVSPSIEPLYSLKEFEGTIHRMQEKTSHNLDDGKISTRLTSEIPSIVQYRKELKRQEDKSPSTAVLYSERELKEAAERMRMRHEGTDSRRISIESTTSSEISHFPFITSDSEAASLKAVYSERELANIAESMRLRYPESSAIPFTEKELFEMLNKKLTVPQKESTATFTAESPIPGSTKDSLSVLYSEKELKEMNEKMQMSSEITEFDAHYSKQHVKEASPSIVVMYSEKEIEETRRRFEATSSPPLSDVFTFGTVSNVPSLSFFMEEKMRYKIQQVPVEEKKDEEEEDDWEIFSAVSLSSGPSNLSGWELIGHSPEDWNSIRRPGNGVLEYFKLDLDESEVNGVLTDRIIATGQSCLGCCPGSLGYVYTKLELKGKNLSDISILQYHRYLQYINLSWNQLRDISALGYVRYLVYLDVSHNELTTLLNFRAPWFLCHINYSFNFVTHIGDLSKFWAIKFLDLSHNNIMKIEGLKNLRYLQFLDLSYNEIETIENLESLHLTILNLESNVICKYTQDLSSLLGLKYINLNKNKLTSLGFMKNMSTLRYMDMKENNLSELLEIEILHNLKVLEILDFRGNPITTWPNYREATISFLPSLAVLDGSIVTVEEKIFAKNTFNPDVEIIAAWDHTRLLLFEQFSNLLIGLDIIPVDQPEYPLIVLVGPPSSGKSYLISKIVEEFGNKVYVGLHHTTLNPRIYGSTNYYVTQQQFNDMCQRGEFLSTAQYLGHSFGFSRVELEKAMKMKCVCITNMWLPEALTLHASGVQPCLVLTIVDNESSHIIRLARDYNTGRMSILQPGGIQLASKKTKEHEDHIVEHTIQVITFEKDKLISNDVEMNVVDVPKEETAESINKCPSASNGDICLTSSQNKKSLRVTETEDREDMRLDKLKGSCLPQEINEKDIGIGGLMCEEECKIRKQNAPSSHKTTELGSEMNRGGCAISENSVQLEKRLPEQDLKPEQNLQVRKKCNEQYLEPEFTKENEKLQSLETEFNKQSMQLGLEFIDQNLAVKHTEVQSVVTESKSIEQALEQRKENSKVTECSVDLKKYNNTEPERKINRSSKGIVDIINTDLCKISGKNIELENISEESLENNKGINNKDSKIRNEIMKLKSKESKTNEFSNERETIKIEECGDINKEGIEVVNGDLEESTYTTADSHHLHKDTPNSELHENMNFIPQNSQFLDDTAAEGKFFQSISDFPIFFKEEFKEKFVKMGMQYRRSYFRVHQQNPGFFEVVIHTDELDAAASQLKNFLKGYLSHPKKHPVLSPERDPAYDKVVTAKINKFTQDLNRYKSVMAQQRYKVLRHGMKKDNKKMQKSASQSVLYSDLSRKSIMDNIHSHRSLKDEQEKLHLGKSENANERFGSRATMPYLDKVLQDIDKRISQEFSYTRNSDHKANTSFTYKSHQDCMRSESKSVKDSLISIFSEKEIAEEAKKLERRESSSLNNDIISLCDSDDSVPSVLMYSARNLMDAGKETSGFEIPSTSNAFTFGTVSEEGLSSKFSSYKERWDIQRLGKIEEETTEFKKKIAEWEQNPCSGASSYNEWSVFGCIQKDHDYSTILSNDLDLNRDKNNNILSDQIIATCQSCLRRCQGSQKYVYTKLELKGKNLNDISILQFHHYLQYIDLSWNGLEDVSALGYVRHLEYLNASHNNLTKLLDFRPPLSLKHVNYSFNNIDYIKDLSDFWTIKLLNLSHNNIKKIEGLHNLRYLLELNLSFNKITQIGNLRSLCIRDLNLEANNICGYEEDLGSLENLKKLCLADNQLTSLGFLRNVSSLHYLDMHNNKLSMLLQVESMKCIKGLQVLDFTNNEITTWPKYRELVISILPSLMVLDSLPVSANDKVRAKVTFKPSININASWNHALLILMEQLQSPPVISLDVIPVDQPSYPFIILVGPCSSGKSYLLNKMAKELGDKVYIGLHHTTHSAPIHEGVDKSYFVSNNKFFEMATRGEFLTFATCCGEHFGFSHKEIEKSMKRGAACLAPMWLTETFMLCAAGITACLILTIPESYEVHHERMANDFQVQKMSSVRIGAGAYKVSHISYMIPQAPSVSTVIAQELFANALKDATKEKELSKTESISGSSSTREKMNLSEICSSGSIKGMTGSLKKIRISSYTSSSSDDMDEFKETILANAKHSKDTVSEGGSLLDLVTLSPPVSYNSKLSSITRFSPILDSGTNSDYEFFSDLSEEISIQGHQLDVISEEPEITILENDYEDQESQKSDIGIMQECSVPMTQQGVEQRQDYLNFHKENPGFFDFAIYTDDLEKASNQLKKFLKYYLSKSKKQPSYSLPRDPTYHQVIKEKIKGFTAAPK